MDNNNSRFNIEELTAPNHGMKRDMGLMRAVGLMAGLMIGSGIFYVGVYVLDYINVSTGWAIVAWILAGLVSLCAGLCYAEMGSAMPRSGGSYVYITESFGPCVGFTMGWSDFWICQTGSIAALGLGFSQYLGSLFGGFDSLTTSIVAMVTVIVLSIINMLGVKQGSTLSSVLLVVKIILIIFIIVACFTYSGGKGDPITFNFEGNGFGDFIGCMAMAIVAALWAFDGWTSVCMVAEEIKNPQKNISKAIAISLLGLTVVYALFNIALMRVLPAASIAGADNPTYDAMEVIFGSGVASILTVGILCSILGSANSATLAYPREYYAMARDKRWLPVFGKINKKTGTPMNSQLITMVYACIICFIADFSTLIDIAVLATWVYYSLAVASCIILRKKYPNIDRPYKVWGYPVLPIIVVIFGIVMLIANLMADPSTMLGLLIPISGIPAYFIFNAYYKKHEFPELD